MFPNLEINYTDEDYLILRSILTPKNEDVDELNDYVGKSFPGLTTDYYSVNTVVAESNSTLYPTEFLDSQNISGLPPHKLSLKLHQPIMLLRNISSKKGLCNGTRLLIRGL